MRAPRHRFSDEVRATTRSMAASMVREGTVAESPEQLEVWISGHPQERESLERDGYGSAFTAVDLFPLLQAAVAGVGAAQPHVEAPPRGWSPVRLAAVALVSAILLGLLIGYLALGGR